MSAYAGISSRGRRAGYLLFAFLFLATIAYFLIDDKGSYGRIQDAKILGIPPASNSRPPVSNVDTADRPSGGVIGANNGKTATSDDIEVDHMTELIDDYAHNETEAHSNSSAVSIPEPIEDDFKDNTTKGGANATAKDNYLAICMAVKDQSLDLPEFLIHHYHNMGVGHFYIMDDGSTPPLSSVQDYGIPSEAITFNYFDASQHERYMQIFVYNQCARLYGANHTWMAFLDADEFLDAPGNETLHEVLESFEHNMTVGALAVNWRVHTSAGLLHRPESNRQSFNKCIYDDEEHNGEGSNSNHVKLIVKMSEIESCHGPHQFYTKNGTDTVGELGDFVGDSPIRRPITRQRVGLHHYELKSWDQFEQKVNRSNGMGDPKGWKFWDDMEALPQVDCREMMKYDP